LGWRNIVFIVEKIVESALIRNFLKSDIAKSVSLMIAEKRVANLFSFYTTSDPDELDEIFQIRYRVYCEEYKYLNPSHYSDNRERDRYDPYSLHLVIRHKSGELAATSRLILNSPIGLPIEKNFDLDIEIPQESRHQIGEVSRLIVARRFRRQQLLLVLIKGLYLLSKKYQINDVFCVLDDRLQPNLLRIGVPLKRIGRKSIFQGLTAPYLIHVNELEEVMGEKNRSLMKFFSNGEMKKVGNDFRYAPH
jgi:N-acyl-L-homoserine lactone synthetase